MKQLKRGMSNHSKQKAVVLSGTAAWILAVPTEPCVKGVVPGTVLWEGGSQWMLFLSHGGGRPSQQEGAPCPFSFALLPRHSGSDWLCCWTPGLKTNGADCSGDRKLQSRGPKQACSLSKLMILVGCCGDGEMGSTLQERQIGDISGKCKMARE